MLSPKELRRHMKWLQFYAGADTGTYMGGLIAGIDPDYNLFAFEEFPNYRYTGDGTIELTGMTVGEWFKDFGTRLRYYTGQRRNSAWVDANTTFKTEVAHGVSFRMNKKHLELRTEITREYLRNGRIHLMPWLQALPYEMEEASYPEQESAGSGRMVREKFKDHILDCLEHICSRRPHPDFSETLKPKKTGIHALIEQQKMLKGMTGAPHDVHLGVN